MFKYKNTKYKLDIVFPNKSYGGVYSLGPLIIQNIVNKRDNWHCERIFSDQGKVTSELVGFTLQWELDLQKAIDMKGNGINFAGGPLASMNPKLIGQYFDFLILGDVEAVLPFVLTEYERGEKFLENISNIEGVYVPGKNEPRFKLIKNLDDAPYPIIQPFPEIVTKDFVFGKTFILEIERGCTNKCNYCPLPNFYSKCKFRSLENLKQIIDEGLSINHVEKVIIYAPSFIHPKRKEILQYLINKDVIVTIPSIRAETMDKETMELIKKCGQESLTLAPECGESLRLKINKNVKDISYFKFIDLANETGFKKLKLYMQIGLPDMTDKDLEEWINLVKEIQKKFKGKLNISVNYFVPKPTTTFQDHIFDKKELKKQANYLKKHLKIEFKLPSLSTSYKEWKISKEGI
ncbi:MAG: radical SAM protein [Nanoarchaeota archaeon]|nr:radical SAM protein [Nanoarchaeota archaeon]